MTDVPAGKMTAGEIDVLVGLIAKIEDPDEVSGVADRICEAVCRTTSFSRAVMFRHDPTLGVSTPTGFHGVAEDVIASVTATLDEMPLAQRVLSEDRVIEVSRNLEFELPARYAGMAGITTITCAPVAAAGTWFGVIVADQGGEDYLLSAEDHQRLHTLGRLAAIAATVEKSATSRERTRSVDSRIDMIREIHDQVIQRLFGLSLALGSAGNLTQKEQQQCSEEITAVLGELRAALARPVTPEEPGKPGDTRSFRELVDWFAESETIELHWQDGVETPAHLEAVAISALTEALRNAQRHSDGGQVGIRIGIEEGAFSVDVVNDRVSPSGQGGGLGLRLLTLEALQNDALVEFGPRGDRWHFRLLGPVKR